MKKRFTISLAIGMAAFLTPAFTYAVQPDSSSDSSTTRPQEDTSSAIVQLWGPPLSTALKTKPAAGKKIDFNSDTVKAYRALLNSQRNAFKKWLSVNAPTANVTGKFDISLNAVSVDLNGTHLRALLNCSLVKGAQYEAYYYPTVDDPDLGLVKAIQACKRAAAPPMRAPKSKSPSLILGLISSI